MDAVLRFLSLTSVIQLCRYCSLCDTHTMHATLPKTLLSALLSLGASSVVASSWNLSTTYGPNDFFTGFTWFTDKDPTNGLVLYQSMANARSSNLSTVSNDQFVMAVETTEVALEGRKSVRITSNEAYSDGIYV